MNLIGPITFDSGQTVNLVIKRFKAFSFSILAIFQLYRGLDSLDTIG